MNVIKTKRCAGCRQSPPGAAWPTWAKLVASLRAGSDRGVGDTAERLFGLFGTDQFRRWHVEVFGSPCASQCPKDWNARFPYQKTLKESPRTQNH